MPCSTAVGVLIGGSGVVVSPSVVGPVLDAYDRVFPVMRMSGVLVEREPDAILIDMTGEKLRGKECRLLSVYGETLMPSGKWVDATATRIDREQVGKVRGAGQYDIGRWRIKPVSMDAIRAKVLMQHDCVGRVVISVVADVAI